MVPRARRLGPLTAVEGDRPALAIGDVASRHARLTAAGVEWLGFDRSLDRVDWADIVAFDVHVPVDRWPHPAIADTLLPVIVGVLGAGAGTSTSATMDVDVVTGDGAATWSLESHHVSGYRAVDARTTTELVAYLRATPEARGLLAHPRELLDRLPQSVRRRRS